MKDRIGQTIRKKRNERGISLRKLGEMTGIPHRSICLWENGGGDIGVESLIKIAEALEVTPNDLFARDPTTKTA